MIANKTASCKRRQAEEGEDGMTFLELLAEARENVARRIDDYYYHDYKDMARFLSDALVEAAGDDYYPLIEGMPDGGSCPRAFLDWLDNREWGEEMVAQSGEIAP